MFVCEENIWTVLVGRSTTVGANHRSSIVNHPKIGQGPSLVQGVIDLRKRIDIYNDMSLLGQYRDKTSFKIFPNSLISAPPFGSKENLHASHPKRNRTRTHILFSNSLVFTHILKLFLCTLNVSEQIEQATVKTKKKTRERIKNNSLLRNIMIRYSFYSTFNQSVFARLL